MMFKMLSYVMEGRKTGTDIMQEFGITRNQFYKIKNQLASYGLPLIYDPSTRTYSVKQTAILTEDELEVVRRIGKFGLGRKQIDNLLAALSAKRIPKAYREVTFSEKVLRFVVISDLHVGSQFYRSDILHRAAEDAKRIGAAFILNAGDSVEGMSGRDEQWFDFDYKYGVGITAQAKLLAEELAVFGDLPVFSIEAQGSHGGWAQSSHKGAQGLNVGEFLEMMCEKYGAGNYKFIGFNKADFRINGIRIRLIHPNKGDVISYINGLTGSNKPNMVICGHWHSKVGDKFHRNVFALDAATMQETTTFLERQATESVLGYHICEMVIGEGPTDQTDISGSFIESLSVRFVPFYSKGVI